MAQGGLCVASPWPQRALRAGGFPKPAALHYVHGEVFVSVNVRVLEKVCVAQVLTCHCYLFIFLF